MSNTVVELLLSQLSEVVAVTKNLVAANSFSAQADDFIIPVEKVNEALEKVAVESRNTLERLQPRAEFPKQSAPVLPYMSICGTVRIIEYNWLHIKLNTLLPHCRFQTPQYLSDTITRLLDNYAVNGGNIPRFENAMLIIDEHCDIESRAVFDCDNKGWKAVSNVLKSRLFPDDDQFHLGIALVSARAEKPSCNIFVIDASDTGAFFNTRSDGALYW